MSAGHRLFFIFLSIICASNTPFLVSATDQQENFAAVHESLKLATKLAREWNPDVLTTCTNGQDALREIESAYRTQTTTAAEELAHARTTIDELTQQVTENNDLVFQAAEERDIMEQALTQVRELKAELATLKTAHEQMTEENKTLREKVEALVTMQEPSECHSELPKEA